MRIIFIFGTILVFILTGCLKNTISNQVDINETTTNSNSTNTLTVSGRIIDINGTAIPNAKIAVGSLTTTSDSQGNYRLTGLPSTERLTLNITHSEYFSNSRIIVDPKTDVLSENITMGLPIVTLRFPATVGAVASQISSLASVELPADGYVDSAGNSYTGDVIVRMAYYPITTQSGRAAFPGTFEGKDAEGTFPIQSYGFMNVELTDPNGNKLNLADGKIAVLTYPADHLIDSQPSTIPLWYYDDHQGYWIEEGFATYDQDTDTYIGTVTHFTSWNLDAKGPRAKYNGCVEDTQGNKISNVNVQFRSINWDSYTVSTDTNGNISVYNILANTDLTFSAFTIINSIYYSGEKPIRLIEGEERIDSSCVIISAQSNIPGTVTVTGILRQYDSNTNSFVPVADSMVYIYNASENIIQSEVIPIITSSATDVSGHFSITFNTQDSIVYKTGINYYTSKTFIIQEYKTDYNLGNIDIDNRAF